MMKRSLTGVLVLALAGAAILAAPPRLGRATARVAVPEAARYGAASLLPRAKGGKASGAVTIIPDIKGLLLALSVSHLQPKTTYSVLIYSGSTCANSAAGTVQQMLSDLTTDSNGNATLTDTLVVQSIPENAWYLDVPVKQKDQTKTPGPGVVCGAIHRAGVNVPLVSPQEGKRYTAEGTILVTRHISRQGVVNMSQRLGTELAVYADRLAPRSTFTMRIYTGRCGVPGAVKYRLSSLRSGAHGNAVAITYIPGVLSNANLAAEITDARGHVATCGNFPGYGLSQSEVGT